MHLINLSFGKEKKKNHHSNIYGQLPLEILQSYQQVGLYLRCCFSFLLGFH